MGLCAGSRDAYLPNSLAMPTNKEERGSTQSGGGLPSIVLGVSLEPPSFTVEAQFGGSHGWLPQRAIRAPVVEDKQLDIDMLDHIVIGQHAFVRLKEKGLGF